MKCLCMDFNELITDQRLTMTGQWAGQFVANGPRPLQTFQAR